MVYRSDTSAPIEKKVIAATVGAGAGALLADFVTRGARGTVRTGPGPWLVGLALTAGAACAAAYRAEHTNRPDLHAHG